MDLFGIVVNWLYFKLLYFFFITGIDIASRNLYCSKCNDIVYDSEYDSIVCSQSYRLNLLKESYDKNNSSDKNIDNTPLPFWIPSESERKIIEEHTIPYSVSPHLTGLRGLVNLGNTCFMNSILQCFLNNALLRIYFLSDIHNRFSCTRKDSGVCLSCEMEYLFEEIFSGNTNPFAPSQFLYSIWKYSDYFAGYDQQDAHEFFISALNGIHAHSNGL